MKHRLWWLYLLIIHACLLLAVAKPDWIARGRSLLLGRSSEVPAWYADMHGFYRRQDAQLAPARIVFLGDSHLQGLAVSEVSADAVNFGIGGDTSAALLARLPDYQAVRSAKAIVLVIGTNDLSRRDNDQIIANLKQLLVNLPTVPVLLSTILPVDDRGQPQLANRVPRLLSLRTSFAEICTAHTGCQLLDSFTLFADESGRFANQWHEADGIHLNAAGYAHWQQAIQAALVQMRVVALP